VNGRTLAVLVLLGVAVAGYAVYTLVQPRERTDVERPTTSPSADGEPVDRPERPGKTLAQRSPQPDAEPDTSKKPEVARPTIPDDPDESPEAKRLRKELADLFDRLDAFARRGEKMPKDEWQEAYMEGNNAIHNLARELGSDPNAVEEINEYHSDLRHKLADVEKVPTGKDE
jgi:hypothetical protein